VSQKLNSIRYVSDTDSITADMLHGFFVGWPNPPNVDAHLRILQGSYHVVLAIDIGHNKVIGFINAISDGVLAAYIPLLEVLPAYQKQGIGKELVMQMLAALNHLYMIDLLCDPNLQPYYEKLGMHRGQGMLIRNYDKQNAQ